MYVCVNLLAGHVADGSRKRCISSSYVIAKAKKERRRKLEEGSLFAAVEYEVEHTYILFGGAFLGCAGEIRIHYRL